MEDFENSTNTGFYIEYDQVWVRSENKIINLTINSDGEFRDVPRGLEALCRIISHVYLEHTHLLGAVGY